MNSRRLLLLALICWPLLASAGDGLKPSEMKTKDALHKVIANQLAAFRADNYEAAYAYADAAIKSQFPVEQFEQMVKRGYPEIAHSISATFGLTFDNGDEAVVNVRVIGADQQAVPYQYMLHRDGDSWRITGVALLKDQTTEV
jgi:hypothetical protein